MKLSMCYDSHTIHMYLYTFVILWYNLCKCCSLYIYNKNIIVKEKNKSLGFCPKEKMNAFILKQDLYHFYRQLRFKAYCASKPSVPNREYVSLSVKNLNLKTKSSTVPPTSCSTVEVFIGKVNDDINNDDDDIKSFLDDKIKFTIYLTT